jgi:hypothetical protein
MMSRLQVNPAQIPLSERASSALGARADELRQMAATATTMETRVALENLAERFAALATKRATEEAARDGEHNAD